MWGLWTVDCTQSVEQTAALPSQAMEAGTPNSDVAIRVASVADAPTIARIHVTSWQETYAGLVPAETLARMSIEQRTAMWDLILGGPPDASVTSAFLAARGEDIVGFGSCGSQRSDDLERAGFDAEISALYVLRSAQRRGIGAALMRVMASKLLQRGHSGASLWVLRENGVARRFYEGLGGALAGERTDERRHGTLVEVAYGWPDLSVLTLPQGGGA